MSLSGSKMAKTREEKPVTRNCGITTKMFWMPYCYNESFSGAFEKSTGQLTRIIPAFALKLPPPCTLPPVRFSYAPPFTRYSLPLATPLISNLLTCIWEFLNILPRSSVLSTSSFSPSLSDVSLWMKIVLSSVSMSQSRLVRGRRRLVRVSAN